VDAAVIVLPAAGAVDAARELAAKGVRSIVIVAQGFGEAGGEGLKRDEALLDLARNQGVAIAGPNTNGLANVASGLCLSFAPILQFAGRVKPGRISVVSQSGAVVSSILSKTSSRGVGIAKIAVCGNELVVGLSEYLEYVANDPDTDHVLLYIETIRDPEGLKRALAACRKNGKRVAALLVGESDSGKAAALSPTGCPANSIRW
jgi:acyl-CoA synthetase (NDP forming)